MSGRDDDAFTLLEVVVAGGMLAVIVGLALGVMGTVSDHVADGALQADLAARGGDAAVLVQRELRAIDRTTLDLATPNAHDGTRYLTLSYRRVLAFDAASEQRALGPASELRFVVDPGETIDGADDDGDGLVDEGRLVLVQGGLELDVAANLKLTDAGFYLEGAGGTVAATNTHIRIELCAQQRGRRGALEELTQDFQVGLRN